MIRHMTNTFEGFEFYHSSFVQSTGLLTRVVEVPKIRRRFDDETIVSIIGKIKFPGDRGDSAENGKKIYEKRNELADLWEEKFDYRRESFSPVPETLDISITDWCNFGCSYCYQSSLANLKHAPKELAMNTIRQFDLPPYQAAIGGGEPTAHPDFPWILHSVRECNTVPNFTTAGHIWRDDVIEAANAVCGGVSLTFHAFKGEEYFRRTYQQWRTALKRPQLNVHLIADKDVAVNLDRLMLMQPELGPISLILLAYYPDVGRSSLLNIMPKKVFNEELPARIKRFIDRGNKVAFSEGLLPYFLSRPEIGVDTTFATRSEGLFSAYVSPEGRLYESSFDAPSPENRKEDPSIRMEDDHPTVPHGYERDGRWEYHVDGVKVRLDKKAQSINDLPKVTLQDAWNQMRCWGGAASGAECEGCVNEPRCSTPSIHHYLACAYSEVTKAKKPGAPWVLNAIAQREHWNKRHALEKAGQFDERIHNAWDVEFRRLLAAERGQERVEEEVEAAEETHAIMSSFADMFDEKEKSAKIDFLASLIDGDSEGEK